MLIFDLETDGLLETVSKIHCLVIRDTETGKVFTYSDKEKYRKIKAGLAELQMADCIVGHNVIKYDIPVIQKLYPWFSIDESKVLDTLVLSRLIHSNLKETDEALVHQGKLPMKMWGSHSLKAWGYRLGNPKGDYAEDFKAKAEARYKAYQEQEKAYYDSPSEVEFPEYVAPYQSGDEWKEFSQEMLDYCVQDTDTTLSLIKHLKIPEYSQEAIKLEHQVAFICCRMERHGWAFDKQKAIALYAQLAAERDAIRKEMSETFEPLVLERISEKTGKPLKPKVIEFNPGSRDQIAQRLIKKYGWKPKDFTESGKPKVDEEILSRLEYPEAKTLARYFLLEKRIGMLAETDNSWLALERNGRIHHNINTGGTVSGRCSHNSPNLAQTPAVYSVYGRECRELFCVPPPKKQVGVDLSGIELRCLAAYMFPWDGGAYADIILNGDIHVANQEAAGLETRAQAKTMAYAVIYGSGDARLGTIIGKGAAAGKALKERFFKNIPALAKLKKTVESKVKERGFLVGLDGRKLHVRSLHSCLNLLLQSCGAIIAKRWMVEVIEECDRRGYVWGKEYALLCFCHDETQWEVQGDLAEEFGQMVVECAARAGEYFKFKMKVDAEAKVGNNWFETH